MLHLPPQLLVQTCFWSNFVGAAPNDWLKFWIVIIWLESGVSMQSLSKVCYHQEQNINEVVSKHKESLTSWKNIKLHFYHLVFQSEANWGPISGAGYLWQRELSQIYLKVCVIFRIAWICPNITYIFPKVKFCFDLSYSCPRYLSM